MNTNSDLRNLTDEEVDAVQGGGRIECEYVGSNAWEQWISDYYGIQLVSGGSPGSIW
jgi:hypothetical protein